MDRTLLAPVVLFVMFAACGEESPPGGGVDGPVIFASPQDGGEDAMMSGVLARDGACLYLEYTSGAASGRTAVIWSSGTSWDAAKSRVIGGGLDVAVGELISAGGGGRHPEELAATGTITDAEAIELATRCAEHGDGAIWFVQGTVRRGVPETSPQPSLGGLDGAVIHVDLNEPFDGDREVGIVVLEHDCLYLALRGGDDRAVLVWPDGTSWDAAQNAIVLGDGRRVAIGDEIAASGRFHPTLVTFATGEDVGLRADQCASLAATNRIFVIDDDVERIVR
jgi:hypothetical protein